LFRQIHEIVTHGNGGYDWPTVYHMPIWLRTLTFNLLKEQNAPSTPLAEESWVKNAQVREEAAKLKATKPKYPLYTTGASKK
jgi:hypothetical protein